MDIEYAYRLLANEEIPGWLSMPKAGATTIWEAWEGPDSAQGGIGSLNHYSKGAVCAWLFDTMCGIRADGENRFVIAPRPGGRFTRAEAVWRSAYGEVKSGWRRENRRTVYAVTVPSNCEAAICLPGGLTRTVSAGSWTFEEKGTESEAGSGAKK